MFEFHKKISFLLKEYEKSRGFFGRLFGFFGVPRFRRNPVIKALRKFNYSFRSERELVGQVEVLQCVIQNKSSLLQTANVRKVYDGIMNELLLFPALRDNRDMMIDSLGRLYQSNCLNQETLTNFRIWIRETPSYYIVQI